jgi:simple sugar transport system substrate-binding protein
MSDAARKDLHGKHLLEMNRRQALATMGKVGLGSVLGAMAFGDPLQAMAAATREAAGSHTIWSFTFVNHVTTNPFFTATLHGIRDANKVFGTTSNWTGSETAVVAQMTSAIDTAIAAKADGIATTIVDPIAFDKPVADAMSVGIPVISYNADGTAKNKRLAYVGQDLFLSGQKLGERILASVPKGGKVALFIATPGAGNIQPRIDGALAALKAAGNPYNVKVIATGALLPQEISRVESFYLGNPDVKGLFAVDAGSTQSIAQLSKKYKLRSAKGVKCGGFDLLEITLKAIKSGDLDFTIDQQPYQQGFLPMMYFWLYKITGGLQSPADSDTGLKFVTKSNVEPYLTPSWFEGSPTLTSPVR